MIYTNKEWEFTLVDVNGHLLGDVVKIVPPIQGELAWNISLNNGEEILATGNVTVIVTPVGKGRENDPKDVPF